MRLVAPTLVLYDALNIPWGAATDASRSAKAIQTIDPNAVARPSGVGAPDPIYVPTYSLLTLQRAANSAK